MCRRCDEPPERETHLLRPTVVPVAPLLTCLLALVLSAGCGTGSSVATKEERLRGLPSCGDQELDAPPDAGIDWTHYLRWEERMYAAEFEPQAGFAPGRELGVVQCTRAGSRTPVEHTPRHAEAGFLTEGTAVHGVVGQPVEAALMAEWNGRPWLFRLDPAATRRLQQNG